MPIRRLPPARTDKALASNDLTLVVENADASYSVAIYPVVYPVVVSLGSVGVILVFGLANVVIDLRTVGLALVSRSASLQCQTSPGWKTRTWYSTSSTGSSAMQFGDGQL
ncbi:hypothetical protein OPT61_g7610 [Boeremia exigua]|uniref:Uncharacterized protein n=1 Tax=Boeremia exigua TaxID=749465 RepID=A0ACC2I1J8_9PLEO|nr:hypothetical protein OPT61_g7610 [Boeremia exigua]